MTQIETFVKGIHSRPFSKELNAYNDSLGVEWDYGGKLTAGIQTLTADLWPVRIADLSYWQGDVDFAKLATKVQVVILRAVYGNKYIDPKLDTYYRGASDNGLAIMLYHYMKPSNSWVTHADTFISVEKDYPSLAMWGDLEESGGLNKALLESWIKKYFDKVRSYKEKTGIYSSKGFLDACLGLTNWLKWLDIWLAAWTNASQPAMPKEYSQINNPKAWKIWQWTSKGNGADYGVSSTYIDLNRYNGTVDQFNKEYSAKIKPLNDEIILPPPVPEPQPNFPKFVSVTANSLNVRTSPQVLLNNSNRIGAVKRGTKFKVVGLVDSDWYEAISYINKNYTEDVT